jgi:hypothetical protein
MAETVEQTTKKKTETKADTGKRLKKGGFAEGRAASADVHQSASAEALNETSEGPGVRTSQPGPGSGEPQTRAGGRP